MRKIFPTSPTCLKNSTSKMTKSRKKASSLESLQTDWLSRFAQAIGLLCGVPPDMALCADWANNESEELQSWVLQNSTVSWCSGIGTIDAATVMADTPEEDAKHADRLLLPHQRTWEIGRNASGGWNYIETSAAHDRGHSGEATQSPTFDTYDEAVDALKIDHAAAPEIFAVVPDDSDEIACETLFDVNLALATTAWRTVRVAADTKENAFMLAQRHVCDTGVHGFEINDGNCIRRDDVYCGGEIDNDVEEVDALA